MSFEVDQDVRSELGRDERLLWSGRPGQGIRLRPSDALAVPFSLMWGGFAVFWEYSVLQSRAPFFMRLWGIPFVLIGAYLIVGRFLFDGYSRARTSYGLTDQRVIIVKDVFRRDVKSISLSALGDYSLTARTDGIGTITLGPSNPMAMTGFGWNSSNKPAPALEFIDDARRVYALIREAQNDSAARRVA